MVESLSATSLFGHPPLYGGSSMRDVIFNKRKPLENCSFPTTKFVGTGLIISSPTPRLKVDPSASLSIKALSMGLTKEAYSSKEDRIPHSWTDERPACFWPPENKADNSSLQNPLLRQERMGCGWVSAIFEWEGVLIEDNPDLENQAWLALSQEEGKSPPPVFMLKRIEGMKNEQAISEVLCWSRDSTELKRLANRKEEIHHALQGGVYRLRAGSKEFVNVLMHYKIPMALVSTRPRKTLETAILTIGIQDYFNVIVAAEDVHRGKPDPEMFAYAAQLLKFIPERCIVFGNSNQTVEAAHDAQMKCVAVASKHPVYELGAADLVVRCLDELSVIDLKNLAAIESGEPELEMEEEEDYTSSSTSAAVDDDFWTRHDTCATEVYFVASKLIWCGVSQDRVWLSGWKTTWSPSKRVKLQLG